MKKIFYLFVFCFSVTYNAQTDVEEIGQDVVYNEKGTALLFVNIKSPFSYFKDRKCLHGAEFAKPEFPGGETEYMRLLKKNIIGYIDQETYRIQGPFYLTLDLAEDGKIREIMMAPNVKNSRYFFEDMKFVVKRIKQMWNPAKCNHQNISSKVLIQLNFNSDIAE